MMKDEEELTARFVEEFNKLKQTKSKVSTETGFTPQTLTNITKGYNLPSVMVLSRIKSVYPKFDTNYIITGIKSGDDSEEVSRLRRELMVRNATIEQLVLPGKPKGVSSHPQVDRENGNSLLMSSIGQNKKATNYALLRSTMRFNSPN
jgi:hypothetical protein